MKQARYVRNSRTELEVGTGAVADCGPGFGQPSDVGLIEVDAVREDHVVADQTVAVEKFDIAQTT